MPCSQVTVAIDGLCTLVAELGEELHVLAQPTADELDDTSLTRVQDALRQLVREPRLFLV